MDATQHSPEPVLVVSTSIVGAIMVVLGYLVVPWGRGGLIWHMSMATALSNANGWSFLAPLGLTVGVFATLRRGMGLTRLERIS